MLSKGYRNAEEAVFIFRFHGLGLKQFYPEVAAMFSGLYTESDFYTYQSVLEAMLAKIMKLSFSDRIELQRNNNNHNPEFLYNIWGRLKQVRESFTVKQTELVEFLYTNRPAMTYEETSAALGISFDSVRDREDGVIIKMKKEFTEFKNYFPYKDYHKNNIMIWSFMGCRHNPTAEIVHPCYRIKKQNNIKTKELITHGDLFAEKILRNLGLNKILQSNESLHFLETESNKTTDQVCELLVADDILSPEI